MAVGVSDPYNNPVLTCSHPRNRILPRSQDLLLEAPESINHKIKASTCENIIYPVLRQSFLGVFNVLGQGVVNTVGGRNGDILFAITDILQDLR